MACSRNLSVRLLQKSMSDIVIKGNIIREHAGAGIHAYNAHERIKDIYILRITFLKIMLLKYY